MGGGRVEREVDVKRGVDGSSEVFILFPQVSPPPSHVVSSFLTAMALTYIW